MAEGKSALESKSMDVLECAPHEADTDLVIVPASEEGAPALEQWSAATGGELGRALQSREFTGKLFETFLTPITGEGFRAHRLAAAGLGPASAVTVDRVRRVATATALCARKKKIARIAFTAGGTLATPEMIQAIAE